MFKNQLQEFAQRSCCINLPSYSCIREGPDHAPRFKARVNFNGEVFESPSFFSTLRQAEHAAAEVALVTLSRRRSSRVLATRVLDETGVYKNLLQETAHRAGMKLPAYTTIRTGPGYAPVFTCTVELAGMSFSGDQARTKKLAQKSAAMVAWFSLKELAKECCSSNHHESSDIDKTKKEEQEQVIVARYLSLIKLPTDTRKPVIQRNKNINAVLPYNFGLSSSSSSSFPTGIPHQNYPFSSYLSPQYTIYNHHYHHNHLFALPSVSASPSHGFFPLIQSIFRPELLPFAPRNSSPFYYFSSNLFPPVQDRISSHVTIEEIEDNKISTEEQQMITKDKDFRWLQPGFIHNRGITVTEPQSRLTTEVIKNKNIVLASSSSSSSSGTFRPNVWTPEEDTRRRRRGIHPCASQIAPAVQIRSVIPVCSSPVRIISPSIAIRAKEVTKNPDEKEEEEEERKENILDINSEFCRLQL